MFPTFAYERDDDKDQEQTKQNIWNCSFTDNSFLQYKESEFRSNLLQLKAEKQASFQDFPSNQEGQEPK